MARKKAPEELSVEELRRLLVEKRRGARKDRLEHYRRTGRVVSLAPDLDIDSPQAAPIIDTTESAVPAPEALPVNPRRKLLDRILLGVEVLAVLGLVAVILNGVGLLRTLNTEVVAALNPETAVPTPLVMAVVLPSGHTPPDAQGNTRPNDAEIPSHLQPMVQSLANIPVPTAAPDQAVRIQIPALNIDAPVVQGDGWEQLKKVLDNTLAHPHQVVTATSCSQHTMTCMARYSAIWIDLSPATKSSSIPNSGSSFML